MHVDPYNIMPYVEYNFVNIHHFPMSATCPTHPKYYPHECISWSVHTNELFVVRYLAELRWFYTQER